VGNLVDVPNKFNMTWWQWTDEVKL